MGIYYLGIYYFLLYKEIDMVKLSSYVKKYQDLVFPVLDIALNGLNYFFHIFVSWYLIPTDYGILNSLLSLSSILFVFGISFQVYTAKSVAKDISIREFSKKTFSSVFFLVMIVSFVLLAFIVPISRFTRGSSIALILVFSTFVVNAFLSVHRGIFQGKQEFLSLNFSFYAEVVSKTLFLLIFLRIFKNIEAALFSILLGMTISLFHSMYVQSHLLSMDFFKTFSNDLKSNGFFKDLKNIIQIFFANFFLYFYTSIDVILVNYFLPERSGIYAVVIRYSQILLFVIFSIITVFLPYLSATFEDRDLFRKKVRRYFTIILSIEVIFAFLYLFVFPPTIEIFFGIDYAPAASFLFLGCLSYSSLVLSFFMVNVFLVSENKNYLKYLFLCSISITSLYILFHDSLIQIFTISIVSYFILFLSLLIDIRKEILK